MSVATQTRARPRMPAWTQPTRLSSALFAAKVAVFQLRRSVQDVFHGPPRHAACDAVGYEAVIGENRTPLWSDEHLAERTFQQGKVQNLRRAAVALDGLRIPAGQVFSFWRQVGRARRSRGFVAGRMLQQGCMMPATGGGLCQLSNALYDVALQAGAEIVERHAHSRIVPGSAAAYGRDATVAWNYVDLRFRPQNDVRLEVRLGRETLTVRLLQRTPGEALAPEAPDAEPQTEAAAARSCGACDETDCFMHEHGARARPAAPGCAVFLVDEAWPEFRDFVARSHAPEDRIGLPIHGERLRLPRYAWDTAGFSRSADAAAAGLRRALAIRAAGGQGPRRRNAELDGAARVARRLSRLLTPEVADVIVAQSLLPTLWREGHLGGRRFSVLMTRLPMAVLQARLDAAFAAHPERRTLGDFRVSSAMAREEAEALAAAESIITPHAEVAALFGDRARRLAWDAPGGAPYRGEAVPGRIAFPGPTVARKGAFAVREAARRLDLEVVLTGSELEGADFWQGVRTLRPEGSRWLDGVAAVVQPALVEERPRALLSARSAGVPVIASSACGLDAADGVTLVRPDDADDLVSALGLYA